MRPWAMTRRRAALAIPDLNFQTQSVSEPYVFPTISTVLSHCQLL
jgi:hypothetical protein